MTTCRFRSGCDQDAKAKGLCHKHYQADRRAGLLDLDPADAWRKTKTVNLKAHYRMTLDAYEHQLYVVQAGRCLICLDVAPETFTSYYWPVDHDHLCCAARPTCGSCNRGILCISCNRLLTKSLQDPAWIASAAAYLEREPMAPLSGPEPLPEWSIMDWEPPGGFTPTRRP